MNLQAVLQQQEYSNWPTYPQLYANGELLGGCDIILELHASRQLKDSIAEALGDDSPDNAKPDLQERLKQLVNAHSVMLFMKVGGPFFSPAANANW